jgi:phosphatidylethanolamine/phosphatidyl-N-methylethanolamine N-methyltransferase
MHSMSFFLQWLSAPLRVGAIAPSSAQLAKAITAEISAENAPVIELGAGSGVFTRALIERGVPQARLALVEQSEAFAGQLAAQFPQARVFCMDAAQLEAAAAIGGERAGAVVSGLPLLLMSSQTVGRILQRAFECLRPEGAFYQFTYAPRSPVSRHVLERLGLAAVRVGTAPGNFPPAFVYRIRRSFLLPQMSGARRNGSELPHRVQPGA